MQAEPFDAPLFFISGAFYSVMKAQCFHNIEFIFGAGTTKGTKLQNSFSRHALLMSSKNHRSVSFSAKNATSAVNQHLPAQPVCRLHVGNFE